MDTIADPPSVNAGPTADTDGADRMDSRPPRVEERFSWWELLFELVVGLFE